MNNLNTNKSINIYIILLSLLLITACESGDNNSKNENKQAHTYVCPMHPEVRQNEKGRCPKCGMDLVPEKEVEKDEHKHDSSSIYTCPMHPEVRKHEKGRCPKCGMDLVPEEDVKKDASGNHSHNAVYTCSMHPQIRQKEKGRCPICGMDLILATETEGSTAKADELKMSGEAMKLANVKTTAAKMGQLVKHIRMNGKMQVNEQNVYVQTTHIEGRIEQLIVNYTGMYVKKGQVIAYIYSPALSTAQQELIEAQKIQSSYPELFQASVNKLKNWKISEYEIGKILQTGDVIENFPIVADRSGYVTKRFVDFGEHIHLGQSLYELVDYSTLWALFDVYESDYNSLSIGSRVDFVVNALPGNHYSGKVTYIDPFVNPSKRSIRVRIVVNNKDNKLLPEMLVVGNSVGGGERGVIIPKSAVLWTGKTSIVFVRNVDSDYNLFLKREVVLGGSSDSDYIVMSGLDAGELVVSNGLFSVDAATQLSGKPSMMN